MVYLLEQYNIANYYDHTKPFSVDMFVNYDLKKSLRIFELGAQGVAKVYQLTIGNKQTTYQYLE